MNQTKTKDQKFQRCGGLPWGCRSQAEVTANGAPEAGLAPSSLLPGCVQLTGAVVEVQPVEGGES